MQRGELASRGHEGRYESSQGNSRALSIGFLYDVIGGGAGLRAGGGVSAGRDREITD